MKHWTTLFTLLILNNFAIAQFENQSFQSKDSQNKIWFSDNNFFQYRGANGLMYDYLFGKWTKEKDALILTESYHSEKSENIHHIRKAPKFEYTTAQRISTFKIEGNQLILIHQEITPKEARFITNLATDFIKKEQ